MDDNKISIYRGDDETYVVTVTDEDGDEYTITGAALYFTVREYADASDAIVEKNSTDHPSQFTVTGTNTFEFNILSSDTSSLTVSTYVYDFEILTYDGKRHTIAKDKFEILGDVTR